MLHSFTVKPGETGQRLDLFLKNKIHVSRQAVQENIKNGRCLLNGEIARRCDQKVQAGQKIEMELSARESAPMKEPDRTVILWEDAWLAICDKPPNLVVHPCPSCPTNTLLQQLLSRYPQLEAHGGLRPGIAHRLDKDTSGLLVIALAEETRLAFSEMLARHEVFKEYLCLVQGKLPDQGMIEEPIGRDPRSKVKMAIVPEKKGGRPAKSGWRNLRYFPEGDFSIACVRIFTGRTHQIRVHMAHLDFPLLGDRTYAPAEIAAKAPRQMLHAFRLSFSHPQTGEKLDFTAPPPGDFMKTILDNCSQTPLIIITGNPGCGKSTFAKHLASLGLPYMSADQVIADIYKKKGPLQDWVERNMGFGLVNENGIDKARLLDKMKNDPRLKKEFENYAHMLVYEKMMEFYDLHRKQAIPGIILEIPLYFESGGGEKYRDIPKIVIGVHCPLEIRRNRLRENRNWPDSKTDLIESWQWPEEKKMSACQIVIDNFESASSLAEKARETLEEIESFKQERLNLLRNEVKEILKNEAERKI